MYESLIRKHASLAQLGERKTEDLKVTGSIPVGGKLLLLMRQDFVWSLILLLFISFRLERRIESSFAPGKQTYYHVETIA